jgi:hypothetical protein
MKRCFYIVLILLAAVILFSCSRISAGDDSDAASTPSTSATAGSSESAIPVISETPVQSEHPLLSDRLNEKGLPIYTVKNYLELQSALGSNREIELLPGDYNPVNFNKGHIAYNYLQNLTLKGMPDSGQKYVSFATSSGLDTVMTFNTCSDIVIKNLDVGHTEVVECFGDVISISNCKNIIIDNCRLFGSGKNGLVTKNTEKVNVTNSLIEDCSSATLLIQGKNNFLTFAGCTLKDNDINIWNDGDAVLFIDCKILSQTGTLSTMDMDYPIRNPTGYESDWGTESWNPQQRLYALYHRSDLQGNTKYVNTYDGNEDIYNQGAFTELIEAISRTDKFTVSLDQNIADNTLLTLKIHYTEMFKKYSGVFKDLEQLKPAINSIKKLSFPVTLIVHDNDDAMSHALAYEFSVDNFLKLLQNPSEDSFVYTDSIFIYANSFTTMNDIIEKIRRFITWEYPLGEPEKKQYIYRLFSSEHMERSWDYYSIDSHAGTGDLVHYSSDLIFKADRSNKEIYLLDSDSAYMLLSSDEQFPEDIQKSIVSMDPSLKANISGDISLAIAMKDLRKPENDVIYFQTIEKIDDDASGMEYIYRHYIASYNKSEGIISDIRPYKRIEYAHRNKHNSLILR